MNAESAIHMGRAVPSQIVEAVPLKDVEGRAESRDYTTVPESVGTGRGRRSLTHGHDPGKLF